MKCKSFGALSICLALGGLTVIALLGACGAKEEDATAVPTYTNTPLPLAPTDTIAPTDAPPALIAIDTESPTNTPFLLIPTDTVVPMDTPLLPASTSTPVPTDTPAPVQVVVATDTPVVEIEPQTEQRSAEIPLDSASNASSEVVISLVHNDGREEWAVVANQGGTAVNLSGWRLNAGHEGQDAHFSDYLLEPGAEIQISTQANTGGEATFSFNSSQNVWNNDGDCGYLYNANGIEVSSYCYSN